MTIPAIALEFVSVLNAFYALAIRFISMIWKIFLRN